MISISSFKAFPQIPDLAENARIKLEFTGLIDPIKYSNEFIENVKSLKHFKLYKSAHAPFIDLIPPSKDIEIRELSKEKFQRAIEACSKLDIKKIVFHTGWMKDFYSDNNWIQNSIEFWKEICEYANNDTKILLENVFEPKPYLIKSIIDGVANNKFKVCLDVGHINLTSNRNIEEWISELSDSIEHVHIHNNHGIKDDHNGLNDGTINIEKIMDLIKDKCPLSSINMEIRNNFEKSIEIMNKYK